MGDGIRRGGLAWSSLPRVSAWRDAAASQGRTSRQCHRFALISYVSTVFDGWQSGTSILSWAEQIFNYCERGLDPSFWAEPVNAVSNGAFLLAAAAGAIALSSATAKDLRPSAGEAGAIWLLIVIVAVIGIGSFLFHTYATRWAMVADVAPITAFMVAYLAYALRMFVGLPWPAIGLALVVFLYIGSVASSLTCADHQAVGATVGAEPCLNGSLGYAPALASLLIVGTISFRRDRRAGRRLLLAAGVFLVSMALRTVDQDICDMTRLFGQSRGTHALWHLLNALTLYLLLMAAIDRERRRT